MHESESLPIPSSGDGVPALPGLLTAPADPVALLVLAHGAGAGMRHGFMEGLARALAGHGVASLRWEFPYMAAGGRRPDRPPVAVAAVRRAVAAGLDLRDERYGGRPVFAGGKSFGGRMTTTAAAEEGGLPGVAGLVLVGFPLHPAGRPGIQRAEHLARVDAPLLFLQGTRDALAGLDLLRPVVEELGARASLHLEEDADHGFHVRKRSGRDDPAVLDSLAAAVAGWVATR